SDRATDMDARFPVFILESDDFSFREFQSADELQFCEEPDIVDGLYTGWDSRGRRLSILWDKASRRAVAVAEEETSLESCAAAVETYAQRCEEAGIRFPPRPRRSAASLCDPEVMRERIAELRAEPRRKGGHG